MRYINWRTYGGGTPTSDIFSSGSQNFNTTIDSVNCTINRTAAGRYTVVFGGAHPKGTNYSVVLGQEESGAFRDVPKVSVVQGTRTALGFNIQVTIDDNGGAADIYRDDTFSFAVMR